MAEHTGDAHPIGTSTTCRACLKGCFCRGEFECVKHWIERMRRKL
jgi:pentatricopeptide repeat protein